MGKVSNSAFVNTVLICTISDKVSDSLSSSEILSCQFCGVVSSSCICRATSGSNCTDSASELLHDCLEHGLDCGTE